MLGSSGKRGSNGEMVEKRKRESENSQNEGLVIPDTITFSEFVDTLGRIGFWPYE